MAAELAGGDPRLQVGRQGCGCERENAVLGTTGRRGKLADDDVGHVQLGILFSQLQHVGDGLRALTGRENFGKVVADLRSEHAEPHFFNFGTRRPEFQEVAKIAGAFHHLTCHSAVDGDFLSRYIFQDPIVSGGGATSVVFGLQSVNGNNDVEARHVSPSGAQGAEGAGDDLHVDSTSEQLGNERLKLAIANQRIAADERQMQRLETINDFEDAVNESLAAAIVQLAQRLSAAQMRRVVSVTAWTSQRTFPRDFEGERRALALENFAPRLNNLRSKHDEC